jgi:hypothetical protein
LKQISHFNRMHVQYCIRCHYDFVRMGWARVKDLGGDCYRRQKVFKRNITLLSASDS